MANTINFSGATVRKFEFVPGPKRGQGSASVRIEITAKWTVGAMKAMGWEELPESLIGTPKLRGDLAASHLILTPNDKEIRKHEVQVDINRVSGFEVFLPESKDGKPKERELRFSIETADAKAEAMIGNYCRKIGSAPANLKIGYVKQEALEMQEQLISEEQAADTADEE